jgi:uncharacterized phiE125 gp8 family phage protein
MRIAMTPLLLTPPLLEPVTLAEAKTYLKLDTGDEDDLVQTLITAARLMIEAASGNMLIDQLWRVVLDEWPAAGRLRLPVSPVRSVTGARIYDSAGQPQMVAPSTLVLEAGAEPPMLLFEQPVPAPGRVRQGIEIDLQAGFGPQPTDVPAPLRQAILRLVANWFENRGDALSGGATALPREIMALIAPYRRVRL